MAYITKRTDSEIDDQLNKAAESEDTGISAVPGMTYEQGVQAALLWVFGQIEDVPIEDE